MQGHTVLTYVKMCRILPWSRISYFPPICLPLAVSASHVSPLLTSQRTFLIWPDYPSSHLCLSCSFQNALRCLTSGTFTFISFLCRKHFPHLAHLTKHPEDSVSSLTPFWKAFQTPLRSIGSTQAWLFMLVSPETKLTERGDRFLCILHTLLLTHGLGEKRCSKKKAGWLDIEAKIPL